jgi:SNF2 family DNA or RNA helicase
MLTATPIQNDLMELYSLITILSPGQLGTVRGFRRHFLQNADKRQPKNESSLRRLLGDVMIRNRRSSVDVTFPGGGLPSITSPSRKRNGSSTPMSATTSAAASAM